MTFPNTNAARPQSDSMDSVETAMIKNDRPGRGRSWLIAMLLAGTASIGFALWLKQSLEPVPGSSPRSGTPFPALEVEGWLNGPGPTADELKGKVLVVDAWAFGCMPCRMAAPGLIELERKYRDRGVVFLGLTSDGKESLAQSKRFLTETGVPWPNGYGADRPLNTLESDSIPRVWVVGRDGRIVEEIIGFEPSHTAVRDGIERALATQP